MGFPLFPSLKRGTYSPPIFSPRYHSPPSRERSSRLSLTVFLARLMLRTPPSSSHRDLQDGRSPQFFRFPSAITQVLFNFSLFSYHAFFSRAIGFFPSLSLWIKIVVRRSWPPIAFFKRNMRARPSFSRHYLFPLSGVISMRFPWRRVHSLSSSLYFPFFFAKIILQLCLFLREHLGPLPIFLFPRKSGYIGKKMGPLLPGLSPPLLS